MESLHYIIMCNNYFVLFTILGHTNDDGHHPTSYQRKSNSNISADASHHSTTTQSNHSEPVNLKKNVGLVGGIALIVGTMIGKFCEHI